MKNFLLFILLIVLLSLNVSTASAGSYGNCLPIMSKQVWYINVSGMSNNVIYPSEKTCREFLHNPGPLEELHNRAFLMRIEG